LLGLFILTNLGTRSLFIFTRARSPQRSPRQRPDAGGQEPYDCQLPTATTRRARPCASAQRCQSRHAHGTPPDLAAASSPASSPPCRYHARLTVIALHLHHLPPSSKRNRATVDNSVDVPRTRSAPVFWVRPPCVACCMIGCESRCTQLPLEGKKGSGRKGSALAPSLLSLLPAPLPSPVLSRNHSSPTDEGRYPGRVSRRQWHPRPRQHATLPETRPSSPELRQERRSLGRAALASSGRSRGGRASASSAVATSPRDAGASTGCSQSNT